MKIITSVVNNPDFIELQYHTLKKYILLEDDDFEYIVFNDAKAFPDFTNEGDTTIRDKIEQVCKKLNITHFFIPNDPHRLNTDASMRTADSMNYIVEFQKKNPDRYLLLDSDMFLIGYFNLDKFKNYECALVLQSRGQAENKINYFWNGLYYFDMLKMKNIEKLNWNCCPHSDTGGCMQDWLICQTEFNGIPVPDTDDIRRNQYHHSNTIYYIRHLWSCSWDESELPTNINKRDKLLTFLKQDIRNENGKFFCEIYDNVFLHYRAGGNWRKEGMNMHHYLTNQLKLVLQ